MTENKVLMQQARESLTGNWGLAAGTFFVYMCLAIMISIIPFGSILLGGPLALGIAIFSLSMIRYSQAELGYIFKGFNNFGNAIGAYLLMMLIILAGFLLLIVPGIIAAFALSMTFFIMADDESIGPLEALKASHEMMKGNKMKFFKLNLRFIPLALLCLLTLGIGFFWLLPYMQVSIANFYEDISGQEKGAWISEEDIIEYDPIQRYNQTDEF